MNAERPRLSIASFMPPRGKGARSNRAITGRLLRKKSVIDRCASSYCTAERKKEEEGG